MDSMCLLKDWMSDRKCWTWLERGTKRWLFNAVLEGAQRQWNYMFPLSLKEQNLLFNIEESVVFSPILSLIYKCSLFLFVLASCYFFIFFIYSLIHSFTYSFIHCLLSTRYSFFAGNLAINKINLYSPWVNILCPFCVPVFVCVKDKYIWKRERENMPCHPYHMLINAKKKNKAG